MVCGRPLGNGGIHLNQCKNGGHVIRRHDRVVRWLAGWIEDRIGSQMVVEQAVAAEGEEEDRLDLTLGSGGRRLWLDVAIVNVMTINPGERFRRAKLDGAAARHEEGAKRSRYQGLAISRPTGGRVILLALLSLSLPRILSLGVPRWLLRLGGLFRPLSSLNLLLLGSGRVGIRLPIGIMLGTTYSFFSFPH